MFRKFASTWIFLLVGLVPLGSWSASASAKSPPAFAAPGTFACQPATAANKVPTPRPIWEYPGGKPPSAEEVATVDAIKPLCPTGQVPLIPASGEAVSDPAPTNVGVRGLDAGVDGQDPTVTDGGCSEKEEGEQDVWSGCGCEKGGCFWYAKNEVAITAIGMTYTTSVSEPHVSSFGGAHSIDQLSAGAMVDEETHTPKYTIETGFDVDPDLFTTNPENPHFFIFVNPDNYGPESCYIDNEHEDEGCKHFIPTAEPKIYPNETFEPEPITSQIKLGVKYLAECFPKASGGCWWVWAGTEWIGYVPASFWGNHFTKVERGE